MAKRTRRRSNEDERILPLINVVFLLLIVFMLMGRLAPTDPFEVVPPQSNRGAEVERLERVILLDADGRLALDGEPIKREALLRDMSARLVETPDAQVRLKADGRVLAVDAVGLMEDLRVAGVSRLELLTEHVEVPR